MKHSIKAIRYGYGIVLLTVIGFACSKSGDSVSPPPAPDLCAGKNITVTATGTDANPCVNDGTISATGSGGTSLTYSMDGSNFQASGNFNAIAAGSYTITVKDGAGCRATASVVVSTKSITKGPLWTDVRTLITTRCAIPGCHSGSAPQGGFDFTNDCVVLGAKNLIKTHAVDLGDMPFGGPMLSTADKRKSRIGLMPVVSSPIRKYLVFGFWHPANY